MVLSRGQEITKAAKIAAELDLLCSFAELARTFNYTKPTVTDSLDFEIVGGRHPVVERLLEDCGRVFTRNDCCLTPSASRLLFITGPNMGGKSTFLRQNALVSILAQCGSFVPAKFARLGLVDAIYTRIGAADDLARDRSTFMLEMLETASILAGATQRSLVIMDEIGRGTGADEGQALAHAICEHLYNKVQCRVLFATHYTILGKSVNGWQYANCWTTSAEDDGSGNLVFLHRLVKGVASQSYAIAIARMAGIPETVLAAAQKKLDQIRGPVQV